MNEVNQVKNPKNIAILGLGWLGLPLAKTLRQTGHDVRGSVSSVGKLERLQGQPFEVVQVAVDEHGVLGDLHGLVDQIDVLIITIPPGRKPDVENTYPTMIDQLVKTLPPTLKVIYTSTTGVYADDNAIVNESTEPRPTKSSGKAVLEAESILAGHFEANLTVLRLAGLFGPDRHPGRFLAGKTGLLNGEAPVNLVHQTDCIGVIRKVIEQAAWGNVLNVCAGQHPTRKAYYQQACIALKLDPPQFDDAATTCYKIVDNAFGRELLNYTYQYDDPRDIFSEDLPQRGI